MTSLENVYVFSQYRDPFRAMNILMKKGMEPKKITLILHLLTDAILTEPIFKPCAGT